MKIIIVTPTYSRKNRLLFLKRCIRLFSRIDDFQWIVVEDGQICDPEVKKLLLKSSLPFIYLHFGPTHDHGTSQRNHALTYIRDKGIKGIIYLADDDNYYQPRLFDQIRKTKKASVFPVGHLGPRGIERPIVKDGRIVGWDCGWLSRKYPLDWAGIAFNAELLKNISDPILKGLNYFDAIKKGCADLSWSDEKRISWLRQNKDGESEFIDKIIQSKEDFEILCDNCSRCYAWHDQPLYENPRLTYYKKKLKQSIRNKISIWKREK